MSRDLKEASRTSESESGSYKPEMDLLQKRPCSFQTRLSAWRPRLSQPRTATGLTLILPFFYIPRVIVYLFKTISHKTLVTQSGTNTILKKVKVSVLTSSSI